MMPRSDSRVNKTSVDDYYLHPLTDECTVVIMMIKATLMDVHPAASMPGVRVCHFLLDPAPGPGGAEGEVVESLVVGAPHAL